MRRQLASDAAAEAQRLAAGMRLICSSLEDGSCVACMKCTAASVLSMHALRHSGSLPGSDARRPVLCLMPHARPSAEAAGKAAQAEELRIRFEALSAQKAGLVQQLKQVHRTLHTPARVISVSRSATAQHSRAISSTGAEKSCCRKSSWTNFTNVDSCTTSTDAGVGETWQGRRRRPARGIAGGGTHGSCCAPTCSHCFSRKGTSCAPCRRHRAATTPGRVCQSQPHDPWPT